MGPGTIRCLAHSAWPMLWVRQCALSPYPLADYLSGRSVHGARRCDSGGRYHNVAAGLNLDYEGTSARASECRLRASIGTGDLSARRCAEHEKNLLFSASRTARAKQHASPQRSGAQFKHYYARPRPVRALGCRLRACSDGCSTKALREPTARGHHHRAPVARRGSDVFISRGPLPAAVSTTALSVTGRNEGASSGVERSIRSGNTSITISYQVIRSLRTLLLSQQQALAAWAS